MKRSPNLKSQRGFTLIETMIAGFIGMFLIVGLTSAIVSMGQLQRRSDMSSESAMFEREFADAMKSGNICTATLTNQILNLAPPSNLASMPGITLAPMMMGGTMIAMNEGTVLAPGIQVTSMKLVRTTSISPVDVIADTGILKSYMASLRIQLQRTVNGLATTSPPADIPLKVVVDATNKIIYCNTDTSDGRVCTESGGTWFPLAAGPDRCEPKSTCQFAGGFSEALSGTGSYPNELTGGYSCPTGFTAVRSGSTARAKKCSKSCIGNDYSADYTCVKCGALLPISGSAGAMGTSSAAVNVYAPSIVPVDDYGTTITAVTGVTVTVTSSLPATGTAPTDPPPDTGGGSGCFIAGTQITLGDGSKKSIEVVKVGDQVLSYDESTRRTYVSTVTETLEHSRNHQFLYDVYMTNGQNFVANGVHWIFVVEMNKYIPMKIIFEKFKNHEPVTLLDERGLPLRVSAIRHYKNIEKVFNLHVDGLSDGREVQGDGAGHNYFAGGVLVHNMFYSSPKLY